MAGMFYSLEQAAEKLNINKDEVKKLVEERKLREFRDGSNVLFKVDEVENLVADMGTATGEQDTQQEGQQSEEALNLEPMSEDTSAQGDKAQEQSEETPRQEDELSLEGSTAQGEELVSQEQEQPQAEEKSEDTKQSEPALDDANASGEQELSLDDSLALLGDTEAGATGGDSLAFLEESSAGTETPQEDKQQAESKDEGEDTELSLSLDDGSKAGDTNNEDTAITREGISVLDESDGDFKLSDDTAAETKAAQEASSLEEIEGDVNLDSFGSGSGLLDLSLQADDTSLGGILDEIYTPEGEEGATPAEASAAALAAEAESMMGEESSVSTPAAAVMTQGYVEPDPDASSNIFGGLLLLPLAVVIYTALVTVAGQFGLFSSLVPSQGMMVIYALGGVLVLGLAIAAWGYSASTPAKPKQAKPKKQKPAKVKKEKPKKEKKKKEKKKKK